MQISKAESSPLSDELKALETLLKASAPKQTVEAVNLVTEIKGQLDFNKTSGQRIGKALKALRPSLKKAKQYHAVVKRIAVITGFTDRAVRNWVDPKPGELVEKVSSPAPATAKDVAYRLFREVYDRTREMTCKQFDDVFTELFLTLKHRRGESLDDSVRITGIPRQSKYNVDGSLRVVEVSE